MTEFNESLSSWRHRPVDPRIKPLVDAMNATGRIQTIASCEGHWNRYSTPYVYFLCTPETAREIWSSLTALQATQGLTYDWGIIGLFDEDAKLCFRLQAGELEPPLGLVRGFWHFLFKRARIDADLQVLASLFSGGLKDLEGSFIRSRLPEIDYRTNNKNKPKKHIAPIRSLPFSNWVPGSATGTRSINIGGQGGFTNLANKKCRQEFHSNQRKDGGNLSEFLNRSKEAHP